MGELGYVETVALHGGWGGGIRLGGNCGSPWSMMGGGRKVDFQPLMAILLTASWIRCCMQVYAGMGVVS